MFVSNNEFNILNKNTFFMIFYFMEMQLERVFKKTFFFFKLPVNMLHFDASD